MSILISGIIVIILTILSQLLNVQILGISNDSSVHFGLTTICSIFAGFLYTNYNMLLDFAETELANKVKGTNILKKRNRHIIYGIISAIISIIAGLLLSITYNNEFINIIRKYVPYGKCVLYHSEIIFIFNTIFLFIKSLFEMKQIMTAKMQTDKKLNENTIGKVREQLDRKMQ